MYKTVFSGRRHLTFCGTAVERISTSLPRRTLKIGCKFTKDSPKVPRRGVNIRGFQTFFIPILSENAVVATFSCTISHRIMLRVGHHRQHGHTVVIVEIVFESHTDACIPTDFELGRCTDSATEVGIGIIRTGVPSVSPRSAIASVPAIIGIAPIMLATRNKIICPINVKVAPVGGAVSQEPCNAGLGRTCA